MGETKAQRYNRRMFAMFERAEKLKKKYSTKVINVNFDSASSIKKAERAKARYENAGMKLEKTQQVGSNKFRMLYKVV